MNLKDTTPGLAMAFNDDVLGVATEYGGVYILDSSSLSAKKLFFAHDNSIFDIKWRPNHNKQILTSSGDQSVALWDIDYSKSTRLNISSKVKTF